MALDKHTLLTRLKQSPSLVLIIIAIIAITGIMTQISWSSVSLAPLIIGSILGILDAVLIAFLFHRMSKSNIPATSDDGLPPINGRKNRLTKIVKNYLNGIWFVMVVFTLLLPIITAITSIDYYEGDGTWGVDINPLLAFQIDMNQLIDIDATTEGIRDGVITGKTALALDTGSVRAWYLFMGMMEISLLVSIYIISQMRALFHSLDKGHYFTNGNCSRLQKMGIALLAYFIAAPFLQYFGGKLILQDISVVASGINITPAFELAGDGLLLGVCLLILSGVCREATAMYEDQIGTV